MNRLEILIIGAGSLGCLFGGKLAIGGVAVNAFVSDRRRRALAANGLALQTIPGSVHRAIGNFRILGSTDEFFALDHVSQIKICLIAVKTYDLPRVCREYRDIIAMIPNICLLQNGLGNEEIVSRDFPRHKIFRIITSNGALFSEPNRVIHTGEGETYLCGWENERDKPSKTSAIDPPPPISELVTQLDLAGLPAEVSGNPQEMIWRKAIVNIGINAFGALTGLKNGELLKIDALPDIMRKTVGEALAVAQAARVPLDPGFDYTAFVFEVIDRTVENKNSMLQDILKESKTEIDFLNARVVKLGAKLGIETPYNSIIVALVKGKELSYRGKNV